MYFPAYSRSFSILSYIFPAVAEVLMLFLFQKWFVTYFSVCTFQCWASSIKLFLHRMQFLTYFFQFLFELHFPVVDEILTPLLFQKWFLSKFSFVFTGLCFTMVCEVLTLLLKRQFFFTCFSFWVTFFQYWMRLWCCFSSRSRLPYFHLTRRQLRVFL